MCSHKFTARTILDRRLFVPCPVSVSSAELWAVCVWVSMCIYTRSHPGFQKWTQQWLYDTTCIRLNKPDERKEHVCSSRITYVFLNRFFFSFYI